jgi:hypothetical protein
MTEETLEHCDESRWEPDPQQSAPAPTQDTSSTDVGAPDLGTRLSSMSTVLRAIGAVLVVAATSTFMLQQWTDGNDIVRYLTLLALTATLTGAGLVCGLGVRESRGARTFLALVIVTVPIHFAVLGGLIQSQFSWDGALAANAPWNADSPFTALWLAALGIAALVPFTWLSMLALVRAHAQKLTWAFIGINLALLLPVRDPDVVAWFIPGMFVLFHIVEGRAAKMGHAMSTREGIFVRVMMLVPVAIIIGRTVLWYDDPSVLFFGLALLSGALACFEWIPTIRHDETEIKGLQLFSVIGATAGWLFISVAIFDGAAVPDELVILLFGLPASGLLTILSTRCLGTGTAYRLVATLMAVGSALVNLVVFWDPSQLSIAGFGCLIVGIISVAYGIYSQRLAPLVLGAIAAIAGLTQILVAAIEIENFLHWGSLAVIGTLLIFAAAFCERYARRLVAFAGAIHENVLGWDY